MSPKIETLGKSYLIFFGLFHSLHLGSLSGVIESLIDAPPFFSLSSWHLILFVTYMALPIFSVFIDNFFLYFIVAGASIVRVLIDVLGVFIWISNLHILFFLLNLLAALFCMVLALDDVVLKVSAEILSFQWSKY